MVLVVVSETAYLMGFHCLLLLNMKSYLIKMDKIIHSQLAKYANKQGMNKSAVITQAVLNLINSHN